VGGASIVASVGEDDTDGEDAEDGEDGVGSAVCSRVRFLVMTVPVEVSEDDDADVDVEVSRFILLSNDLRLT
jgi:hypothetical protein